jgi:hypothetical protein
MTARTTAHYEPVHHRTRHAKARSADDTRGGLYGGFLQRRFDVGDAD